MQRLVGSRQTAAAYCFLARARTYEPAISGLPAENVMLIKGNLKHSKRIDICRCQETYKFMNRTMYYAELPKQFQLKFSTIQR